MAAPQPLLQRREHLEQTASRDTLEHLDGIGYGNGRRDADKQVDVIRLNLLGDHRPAPLHANRVQHCPSFLSNRSGQHIAPILRTPDHMVGSLIDAITVCDDIDHASQFIPHGALRATAIPPLTQVRGFLAEIL